MARRLQPLFLSVGWTSEFAQLTIFHASLEKFSQIQFDTFLHFYEDLSSSDGGEKKLWQFRRKLTSTQPNPKIHYTRAPKYILRSDIRNRKILWEGFGSLPLSARASIEPSLHIPARLAHSSLRQRERESRCSLKELWESLEKGARSIF